MKKQIKLQNYIVTCCKNILMKTMIRCRKNKLEHKHKPKKLFLKAYNYDAGFENEEFSDKSADKEDLTDKKI